MYLSCPCVAFAAALQHNQGSHPTPTRLRGPESELRLFGVKAPFALLHLSITSHTRHYAYHGMRIMSKGPYTVSPASPKYPLEVD